MSIKEARENLRQSQIYLANAERTHYIQVMKRIINGAEKYAFLFKGEVGEELNLLVWFEAQDETDRLNIRFSTKGEPAYYGNLGRLTPEQAAERICSRYKIEDVVGAFRDALSKPLGNYLANKELAGLEKQLLAE